MYYLRIEKGLHIILMVNGYCFRDPRIAVQVV
jgi:hypothetical protein